MFFEIKCLFNLYPTNAPSPFKSASDERTKTFKCPVHSRNVEAWNYSPTRFLDIKSWIVSDSRSGPFTQLCTYARYEEHFVATL